MHSWPKFLHPYPLSEKYFLVAVQADAAVALGHLPGRRVRQHGAARRSCPATPCSSRSRCARRPGRRSIPDKVDLARKDAVVYLPDIYAGDGLKGVPRGTVKSLRLFTYHFAYQGMGGLLGVVGMDGPWDIKRVLGTVPVDADGSAQFRVPANTPISVQPLDAEGKAVQLMRSWMTAMPGEVVQCAGCHEPQNTAPPRDRHDRPEPAAGGDRALARPGARLQLRPRGAAGDRPLLRRLPRRPAAARRHARSPTSAATRRSPTGVRSRPATAAATPASSPSATPSCTATSAGRASRAITTCSSRWSSTPTRRELVQMLRKGHHGVKLDAEAWDRLVTWIDLNCPFHGTWGEEIDKPGRAAPAPPRAAEALRQRGRRSGGRARARRRSRSQPIVPEPASRRAADRAPSVPAGRSTRPRPGGGRQAAGAGHARDDRPGRGRHAWSWS